MCRAFSTMTVCYHFRSFEITLLSDRNRNINQKTITMKKKCTLMVVASLVFSSINVPVVCAQEPAGIETFPTTVLPITGVSVATDGSYNFKSFEVKASEAGSYYTEFWLLPAKYTNNRYTTFMVFVNDDYVDSINPSTGNWQSARMSGNETIELKKGINVITIATLAPEIPAVETLNVALNDSEAVFSPDAYNEFLEGASSGISYEMPEQDGITTYTSDATADPQQISDVPLNYTFYKTFSFTKGQEIFISSSSKVQHKMDVVYYGSLPEIPSIGDSITPGTIIGIDSTSVVTDPELIHLNSKFRLVYTPATSEEMQGLSYVYPSEKALNSLMQVATAKLIIPKTGQYLVRVRHAINGGSSIADVNVNGSYYYENIPITLSYRKFSIPADRNTYATMTYCNNFDKDDPYLFIHGADCDRIVGFNDDGPIAKIKQFNLSMRDSYISQKYFMRTSGISVSNYSSLNPISKCNIITCVSESVAKALARERVKDSDTVEMPKHTILSESVQIVGPEFVNDVISISANEKIQRVSLYGQGGNCIGSINEDDSFVIIPASALSITQPGIYIMSVETNSGVFSQKIVVK